MGALVWVPHDKEVWKKAEVLQKLSGNRVEVRLTADGDDYDPEDGIVKSFDVREIAKLAGEVSSTAMPICNKLENMGVEDMCSLNNLHEPAVLKNLQLRHAQSVPYTYTGQICIAVNPYKWLDLYGKVGINPLSFQSHTHISHVGVVSKVFASFPERVATASVCSFVECLCRHA